MLNKGLYVRHNYIGPFSPRFNLSFSHYLIKRLQKT